MKSYGLLNVSATLLTICGLIIVMVGPVLIFLRIRQGSGDSVLGIAVAFIAGLFLIAMGEAFRVLVDILAELRRLNVPPEPEQRITPLQRSKK